MRSHRELTPQRGVAAHLGQLIGHRGHGCHDCAASASVCEASGLKKEADGGDDEICEHCGLWSDDVLARPGGALPVSVWPPQTHTHRELKGRPRPSLTSYSFLSSLSKEILYMHGAAHLMVRPLSSRLPPSCSRGA